MKKFPVVYSAVFIIVSIILFGAVCGSGSKSEKSIVGILKIVSHPALDAVEKGIQDELREEGYSNVTFDMQNANGEISNAVSIAQKFKTEQVKIAVGIATPCAKALRNALKDSVVIYSAVTDPVDAGLVKSVKKGEKKVAGVSDMVPVKDQLALLKQIKDIRRLGHIYAKHEPDAVTLAKMIKKACYSLDIEFVEAAAAGPSDVKKAARAVAGKVDAFYLGSENTAASAINEVIETAKIYKIPVMTDNPGLSEKSDVLVAWGPDYYKMGRTTGKLVARILSGERPENIPTIFMTEPSDVDLLLNLDVAKNLGLTIPEKLISQAGRIVSEGKIEKK